MSQRERLISGYISRLDLEARAPGAYIFTVERRIKVLLTSFEAWLSCQNVGVQKFEFSRNVEEVFKYPLDSKIIAFHF